jgi:UDP-GlcNAc:undecaprenyl-phosphate/decaprenyl-phosphate GlcNAc-1-phosphate transferase
VSFPLNIYVVSALAAAGVTFALMPVVRRWCLRVQLVDDPGHRKIHHTPIPLAGGLAVLAGLLLPWVVVYGCWKLGVFDPEAQAKIRYGVEHRFGRLAVVLFGAATMVLLGWLDDKHELKPGPKFAGQFLVAAMVAAAGVRITLFVPSVVFSLAITILWILTLINAFNFMDNMNGLCAGLGFIGAAYFGVNAAWEGQYLVASLGFLFAGALLGFLPYNYPKASAFLGDAGSHLVGYMMAVLSILPHYYSPRNPIKLAVLSPLLILAVPLLDMAWVVLLRWRMGKPFYIGDTNHLSHRLTRKGLSSTQAVATIWLVALLLGALSLLFH